MSAIPAGVQVRMEIVSLDVEAGNLIVGGRP